MDTNLEYIKYVEQSKLILPGLKIKIGRKRAELLGVDYDRPKFYGCNPTTGLPCTIVFNEPAPGRSRVMNWNTLTKCWFYSEDAGLTWKRIDTTEEYIKHLGKTDCLINTEYIPGFE